MEKRNGNLDAVEHTAMNIVNIDNAGIQDTVLGDSDASWWVS